MDDFRYRLGQRLKSYRLHKGLSQEKLAELADCHPTYVGQLERGEKNATIESVLKLSRALGVSLSELFDKLDAPSSDPSSDSSKNYPLFCYDILLAKTLNEQKHLYEILIDIEKYKGNIL